MVEKGLYIFYYAKWTSFSILRNLPGVLFHHHTHRHFLIPKHYYIPMVIQTLCMLCKCYTIYTNYTNGKYSIDLLHTSCLDLRNFLQNGFQYQ